jgi:hypothetical protein
LSNRLHPNSGTLRALLACSLLVRPGAVQAATSPAPEWPLRIEGARLPIVLYQPQPDTLEGDKLTGRAAVSIQPAGKDPVFGAVWMEARIKTDRGARQVTFEDIKIPRLKFTGATPEQEQTFSQILADELTRRKFVISLDRLLVSLGNAEKESKSSEGLKNDPPKIYYEKSDAALIIVDGEPVLRPVKDSPDKRVVNTPFELLFTKDKKWRLKLNERWVTAADLNGPWKDEAKASAAVPKIIVSKVPAELIVSKGEPAYTPLPGNDLLYMSNTASNVFVETATSKIFILISGRWYTAKTLDGPWTFVRPDELPAAFTKIPPESPKSAVLVSVPGTEQAKEALLDAQIPQTAVVSRKDKDGKLKITWEGEPAFKDIEGLGIAYSINSSVPVFQAGAEGYWACTDGVWYAAKKPTGPWVVASYVPKPIYQMPPSCPYYNCRYVHIYEVHPDVVYMGYYPGYVGSYPYYGTVVYGTGYPYSGWYGTSYYSSSVMITFGFSYGYYPYYGYGGGAYYRPIGGYPGYGYGREPRRDHVEHYDRGNQGNRGDRGPHADNSLPGNRGPHADTRDNVYADKDGNVSRRTEDGKWQDRSGNDWKDSKNPRQDVQRDSQARDRGAQRASQYQGSRTSYGGGGYGGGYSGGGMRGGGGRGGGRR